MDEREEIVAQDGEMSSNDVAKIIEDLKAQGLELEAIKEALTQMAQEGKITEEELAQAMQMLEEEDKKEASALFGVDIM